MGRKGHPQPFKRQLIAWHALAPRDLAWARARAPHLGAAPLVRLGLLGVGDAIDLPPSAGGLGRVLANVRPVLRVRLATPAGSVARGADVALADLPPLGFVRVVHRGPAPSLQGRREL